MDLGKRFKHFREKTGLNQNQAAEKLGIRNYQLGNYETNRSEPNIATLKKMSALYSVSVDKLIGNTRIFVEEEIPEGPTIDVNDLSKRLTDLANELNAYAIEKNI